MFTLKMSNFFSIWSNFDIHLKEWSIGKSFSISIFEFFVNNKNKLKRKRIQFTVIEKQEKNKLNWISPEIGSCSIILQFLFNLSCWLNWNSLLSKPNYSIAIYHWEVEEEEEEDICRWADGFVVYWNTSARHHWHNIIIIIIYGKNEDNWTSNEHLSAFVRLPASSYWSLLRQTTAKCIKILMLHTYTHDVRTNIYKKIYFRTVVAEKICHQQFPINIYIYIYGT